MRKMLQECMVCEYKAIYEIKTQEDEDIVRAACLPCGHQGLFTLTEINPNPQGGLR